MLEGEGRARPSLFEKRAGNRFARLTVALGYFAKVRHMSHIVGCTNFINERRKKRRRKRKERGKRKRKERGEEGEERKKKGEERRQLSD